MESKSETFILFPSHSDGLALEKILKTNRVKYTIVPTPRDLSKCCGISILIDPQDIHLIEDLLNTNSLISIDGIHTLKKRKVLSLIYSVRSSKLQGGFLMYSVGIDSGSVATKAMLFDGEIVEKVIIPTGWSPKTAAKEALSLLLIKTKINRHEIKKIIGTGYGRVSMSFADKTVTEITCHGRGAHFFNNKVRTILDIGGQDSKVISLDNNGNVIDFVMNDKCAAGTGRFLQVMSNVLGFDVSELDNLARNIEPEPITSMCTVFAESEVISLLAKGVSKEQTASGIVHSIANRGVSIISKVSLSDDIAFTGGVAQSEIIKEAIESKIKRSLYVPINSQIVGALGAAVIGWNLIKKR